MIWNHLIQTYDRLDRDGKVCPIAHTKITARVGVLLDEDSKILAAAKIKQSIFAPCTAESECRSNNVAPHLVHDNASYVTSINPKRHEAYMDQLGNYVADTDDFFCEIVLKYLQAETICSDLQGLIDLQENPNFVITFGIKGQDENTVNHTWVQYYLSKLPKTGICAITGEPDYMPKSYPGGIRYPGDLAKLFCTNSDKLNSMPQLRPGYLASQKIIHALQALSGDWTEQREIPPENIVTFNTRGA